MKFQEIDDAPRAIQTSPDVSHCRRPHAYSTVLLPLEPDRRGLRALLRAMPVSANAVHRQLRSRKNANFSRLYSALPFLYLSFLIDIFSFLFLIHEDVYMKGGEAFACFI